MGVCIFVKLVLQCVWLRSCQWDFCLYPLCCSNISTAVNARGVMYEDRKTDKLLIIYRRGSDFANYVLTHTQEKLRPIINLRQNDYT